MSRPCFLADHDLNENIIDGVLRREPAIEFIRCRDANLDQAADSVVLTYAAENGLIVVSHDVNTMPGHAKERIRAGASMTGLFMVRQATPIGPTIENLVLIWSASELEEWQQQIRFLPF